MTTETSTALDLLRDQAAVSDVSFEQLAPGAAIIPGRIVLSNADDKDTLVGVPFIVTAISFRPDGKGPVGGRDFVSAEAVDKDNRALVINDSSTGMRRQLVQYLQAHKLIAPDIDPDERVCAVGEGAASETFVFDGSKGNPKPLGAPRGLRRSDFVNPETGPATTFYLS